MVRVAIWLVTWMARTWRIRVNGTLPQTKGVVAFWHGDMLPVWWLFRRQNAHGLVSMSNDGRYLAMLLTHWGYSLVRGSSSKGGSEAIAELVGAAKDSLVLVTPDGPRGPRNTAKPGAVIVAHRASVDVFPVRVSMGNVYRFLRSWDLFALPLPFCKISITIGAAIPVGAHSTREDVTRLTDELSQALNAKHR